MSKEHRFIFNNIIVIVEEPYKKDKGCVMVGKKLYDEVEISFKSYDKTLIEFFIKLQKYIADLEAKLAESNNKSYTLESYNNFVNNQCKKLIKENKQLKQQLAEKEKEFNWLHEKFAKYREYRHQDKISFAVEQLEKVKEKANEKQELDWGMGFRYKDHWDIVTEIDNQIKQLKEREVV